MHKRSSKFEEILANIAAVEALRDNVRREAFDILEHQAATLARMAMETLGNRERAANWMCFRQRRLNGKSPYEALADGNVDGVRELMSGAVDTP